MTTFPEVREAQQRLDEFEGDLESDEFNDLSRSHRFHSANATKPMLAHIDAQAAEIERLREAEDALRRALEVIAVGDASDPQKQAAEELMALGYWQDTPEARAALEKTK